MQITLLTINQRDILHRTEKIQPLFVGQLLPKADERIDTIPQQPLY